MAEDVDDEFYNRADSFIDVANEQCKITERGKVSASFMYSLARFNAWLCATGFASDAQMHGAKSERIAYFMGQYREMLEENINNYIENFDRYMKPDQ